MKWIFIRSMRDAVKYGCAGACAMAWPVHGDEVHLFCDALAAIILLLFCI